MDTEDFKDPESYENEIARAIVVLAAAVDRVAVQLKYLGNGDAATTMGAIEAFSVVVKDGFETLASSVDHIALNQV